MITLRRLSLTMIDWMCRRHQRRLTIWCLALCTALEWRLVTMSVSANTHLHTPYRPYQRVNSLCPFLRHALCVTVCMTLDVMFCVTLLVTFTLTILHVTTLRVTTLCMAMLRVAMLCVTMICVTCTSLFCSATRCNTSSRHH